MKHPTVLVILAFWLLSAKCEKEDTCHRDIVFLNNSPDTVYWATKTIQGRTGLCRLDGVLVSPQSRYNDQYERNCWEKRLANESYEIFVVDKDSLNPTQPFDTTFYACDSLGEHNGIKRQYRLTLSDLQASDFTITYK